MGFDVIAQLWVGNIFGRLVLRVSKNSTSKTLVRSLSSPYTLPQGFKVLHIATDQSLRSAGTLIQPFFCRNCKMRSPHHLYIVTIRLLSPICLNLSYCFLYLQRNPLTALNREGILNALECRFSIVEFNGSSCCTIIFSLIAKDVCIAFWSGILILRS